MSEPNTTCPHCKAEIALTEALTAPLIPAIHKKIAEREREVARRESAIQGQRAELTRAVELAEQQLTTRLKTERAIAAEEAKKAQLSELESKSQEVAHLRRELQERETKLAEARNAEAELIRKQGELDDGAKFQHNRERGANCLDAAPVGGLAADLSVSDRPSLSSAN